MQDKRGLLNLPGRFLFLMITTATPVNEYENITPKFDARAISRQFDDSYWNNSLLFPGQGT